MRPSTRFMLLMLCGISLLFLTIAHAAWRQDHAAAQRDHLAFLVRDLGLTDLCLFTEARYTRHPALADPNTPFQDAPLALEHYPSGSLMPPPPHLRQGNRR